jgi:AcrR family transcriptional regulator
MARRNDHTREEIRCMALDAAETIATTKGYHGISTRGIAASIGYTVGTLYLVFENLDDIILQVNGRTLDQLYDWVLERCSITNAPDEALLALSGAYIAYAENNELRWNMLFEQTEGKSALLPEWYQHKRERVFSLVETALQPLSQDEDEIRRLGRVLWAGIHGICTLKIRRRMDMAKDQSAKEMVQMLIYNFLRGFNMNKRVAQHSNEHSNEHANAHNGAHNGMEPIIPVQYCVEDSGIDA